MIEDKPLFSIVIVNYNHGQFLEEAIKSIINQSCDDYELIIVDGGSTDNSIEIIKKYKKNLSWWVSEKDNGQSNAFNKGFSKARGKFFFWLNADDILLPCSLKIAKKVILSNPECLWFAANTIFFDTLGKVTKCSYGLNWYDGAFKDAPIVVNGPTSIYYRNLFFTHKFDETLNYTMDTDLWMRFFNEGMVYVRINSYFWGFRIHEDSKTSHAFNSRANTAFIEERALILKKNEIVHTQLGRVRQMLYKIFTGTYLRSLIDTKKMKGKLIYDVYEKWN